MSDTPETAPETAAEVEPSTVVSESEVLIVTDPEAPEVESEPSGEPAADGDVDDLEADELTGDDAE
jgi:hypothetical protein